MGLFNTIVLSFYIIASLFYVGIFINNSNREHTYFKNPSIPGTLYSERYDVYWFAYFFSVVAVTLIPVAVLMLMLFKNNVALYVILGLFVILQLFTVVIFSGAYVECNNDHQAGNPCNDKRWCCAPEVHAVPGNKCPNYTPCPGGPFNRQELHPDPDFVWIYWFNIWFLVVHILLGLWYKFGDEPEGEEEEGGRGGAEHRRTNQANSITLTYVVGVWGRGGGRAGSWSTGGGEEERREGEPWNNEKSFLIYVVIYAGKKH